MISKKDILKMVRHVRRKSRGIPDRRLIHPSREWLVGLGLFVVVVVAGSVYNVYTYNSINLLEEELTVSDSGVVRYQVSTVEAALEIFRAKEQAFADLRGSVTVSPVVTTTEVPTETETNSEPTGEADATETAPTESEVTAVEEVVESGGEADLSF